MTTTHQCPHESSTTPCCGTLVFELPRTDKITADPSAVTCGKGDTFSERGFRRCQPIRSTTNRETIRVYESSSANSPRVWVSIESDGDDGAGIQLTVEEARRLADDINRTCDEHYQTRED